MKTADRLLRVDEAARLLGLTKATLDTYRSKGKGPQFVKVGGRSIRYSLHDILEYVHQNTLGSTSVQNKDSIHALLDQPLIRNQIHAIFNKQTTQDFIERNSNIKNYTSEDGINHLPWAFDKLILNFQVTEKQIEHLELKLEEKKELGLVLPQDCDSRHRNVYRVKLNRKKDTAFTVLFNDPDKVIKHGVQIQLNPSHFNKKNGKLLNKVLKALFGSSYVKTLLRAYISRIDICFDLHGVSCDAVIYRFKGTRKRHMVKTIKKGDTVYTAEGSRRRNRCKKYKKRENECTRIEFEFYPKSKVIQFKDILSYEMPFKRFEVYSPDFLLCDSIHPHTIHAIEALGITGAINSLNCPDERKELKKVLKEHLLVRGSEQFQVKAMKEISKFFHLMSPV